MKSVKAKIHNKDYVNLQYNYSTGKWEGLIQVPDTPSTDQPDGRYGMLLDMIDNANNLISFDRNSAIWGNQLAIRVDATADPNIQLIYPTPPDYKVRSVYGEEGLSFMEFRVYTRYLTDDDITILFDGQDITELDCYYSTEVLYDGTTRYIRFYGFAFDSDVTILEGTHQITIMGEIYSSFSESKGGLSILSFNLLYDSDPCEFIFDRTQEDVDYVKSLKAKYLQGTITASEKNIFNGSNLKGSRNRSDFVRILTNMIYISGHFGIPFSMTIAGLPEIPNETYVQNLRDEIDRFRSSLAIHSDTPVTPVLPINTYQKMNDLEKILYDIHSAKAYQEALYINDSYYMDGTIGLI